ncbi:MAG: hypothetical protein RL885_33200 [Planctomycetota bacterium]
MDHKFRIVVDVIVGDERTGRVFREVMASFDMKSLPYQGKLVRQVEGSLLMDLEGVDTSELGWGTGDKQIIIRPRRFEPFFAMVDWEQKPYPTFFSVSPLD